MLSFIRPCLFAIIVLGLAFSAHADDILIADFEGADYNGWTVEGEAFGESPARGTLPNQMNVSGYQGEGLANSFHGGDDATGVLTSPEFVIERPFIRFLIGGGGFTGETCINLIIDGEVVRTATGENTQPGGSEALKPHSWDVSEFIGQTAMIKIVDRRGGGWGHINIDHIVQSRTPVQEYRGLSREFDISEPLLIFPVSRSASAKRLFVYDGDERVREMEVSLAPDEPDFWVYLEVDEFEGKTLTLKAESLHTDELDGFFAIRQDDTYPGEDQLYEEELRPQIHFSSKRGWNNDPNGMVYYDGEYHLFYQHNPYGWPWGNMTWGHAVSDDLVHWTELGDALHPDEFGTMFSGSGVVDWNNTTGFQTGDEPPLVLIYTSAGGTNQWSEGEPFTQGIAYSNDRGRTWTKYEGNPVQGHLNQGNRDPKVIWWEETDEWVIVLFLTGNRMAFFRSPDLKRWELQSMIDGFYECPELFELPVKGSPGESKWILYGASGDYFVGDFDGSRFTPDGEAIRFHYGDCFYASQTFSDIPEEDGRRIQIAWGRGNDTPGMPFNQMMMFPVELTLHETDSGLRMQPRPVVEIKKLYAERHEWSEVEVSNGVWIGASRMTRADTLDIDLRMRQGDARSVGLLVHGERLIYDTEQQELTFGGNTAPLTLKDKTLHLRVIVDRTSIEIFANDGEVYMPCKFRKNLVDSFYAGVNVFTSGGSATIESMTIHELNSIWK